ncbi:MAG TPA: hypothetical protein VE220_03020, partial [Gaiellaceae bacterium]|nr:hypothetical protein [Gaiellaceae bacterium]
MRPETVELSPEPAEAPLVSIRDLQTYYTIRGSFVDRLAGREAGVVRAVDGVSLEIRRGEVLYGGRNLVGLSPRELR